jgi:bisanhydrobacterioruberin hydratase
MKPLQATITALVLFIVGVLAVRSEVQAPLWTSAIAVVLFSLPLIVGLWRAHRTKGLVAFAAVGVFGIAIETLGLITGFPYGEFVYGGMLGPLLPGGAPFLLPFAYVPLVIGAVALVDTKPGLRIVLATLLLVAVDLVLDPGAVAFGLWSFTGPAILHGVPLSNFLGWVISGSIAVLVTRALIDPAPQLALSLLLHLSFWTGVVAGSDFLIPTLIGVVLMIFVSRTMRQGTRSVERSGA